MPGAIVILRAIFPFAFSILWFGGGIALVVPFFRAEFAYFHKFPPVDGWPLDSIPGGLPRSVFRAQWAALFEEQVEPVLEAERHLVLALDARVVVWGFGWPLTDLPTL